RWQSALGVELDLQLDLVALERPLAAHAHAGLEPRVVREDQTGRDDEGKGSGERDEQWAPEDERGEQAEAREPGVGAELRGRGPGHRLLGSTSSARGVGTVSSRSATT